jgi:hypothetical protein
VGVDVALITPGAAPALAFGLKGHTLGECTTQPMLRSNSAMRVSSVSIAITDKEVLGILAMLSLAATDQDRIQLMLTRRLWHGLDSLDLLQHLQREVTGEPTAFEYHD